MFSIILPPTNRLLPALVAVALVTLPACGFRGPLYLPGETPSGTETPAATEIEAEKGDDEENDGEENDGEPQAPAPL